MTFFNLDQTSLSMKEKLLLVETRLDIKTVQWNCNHRKLLVFPSEVFSVSNQFLGKKLSSTTQLSKNGINWFFFQEILDAPRGG